MAIAPFESSDSNRHAQPLKFARQAVFDEPLLLERGGRLPQISVAYETYGRLNAEKTNAVLICHALSGDSHVARHQADDDPGWWDIVVGPARPIDTDRYFVICPNVLGGCRGTTGPNSLNPQSGRPYGADFPVITVGDIVAVQRRLVDHLGIDRLLAVVGGSLGGHMVLHWATRHPDRLAGAVPIATSACLTSQALAFDVVGRNAILRDPDFQAGQYYGTGRAPLVGLAIARMLGHITYLSREGMMEKFDAQRFKPRLVRSEFETKFSVGSYLAHQGDRFGERFDANSYLALSMAMDLFDLGYTRERLAAAIRAARCRWLLMSFTSDWLFLPFQSQEIVDALVAAGQPVSYCNIQSRCGHDAFLLPDDLPVYGELIRAFLANLDGRPIYTLPAANPADAETAALSPTSIFHSRHRLDYDKIVELIPPGASVLDLGCGTGRLLARLAARGHKRLVGIEWNEQSVVHGLRRGLDVVQADLNQGLAAFQDGQFDIVVLSQTLQTVTDVERLIGEMLRIGARSIVSFPNMAYRDHRRRLKQGRAPQIGAEEGHRWYNTPNVRFLSLADFEEFCAEKGIAIHQIVALDTHAGCRVDGEPNLNANVVIAVMSK
ncbi:MAG: homoserine O-acetyltransferase [Pirellulales bacterium]|jgi:homoserine O-acetyltransferase|nr:homoserine O-acetyltransferase [Thermoguttaceae bacterium]MDD4786839.1 homoserine O-acetyltransferase [Pirellulales bacterium]MDI9443392.1 homoserine O-acetyltransferase [Planctomycetota bacterium]NLY99528.1 homoserine O-acetyltransferase [Pirellulaceae bacterium]